MRINNSIKYALFIVCVFLAACDSLSTTASDRGTELIESSESLQETESLNRAGSVEITYAPKDHWSGQWRIINIWAEWCKPCWQEIPHLNQFFSLQKNNDIKLLGFNFDELDKTELVLLKEKMSIQFPILMHWPKEWVKPEIKGLPATIILSPDDDIVEILWGPQNVANLNDALEGAKKLSMKAGG